MVLSWLMNIVSANLLSVVVYASSSWVVWEELRERFNKINGSRTFHLQQEISTLRQGVSSSVYFTKLKKYLD